MCSAIAPPITSATSVAIATISACSQKASRAGRLELSADCFGQRAPAHQPELRRQVLHEPGHHVRQDDHPQQREAELRAGADVRGDVARVDVGDGGHEGGAEQIPPGFEPRAGVLGHLTHFPSTNKKVRLAETSSRPSTGRGR